MWGTRKKQTTRKPIPGSGYLLLASAAGFPATHHEYKSGEINASPEVGDALRRAAQVAVDLFDVDVSASFFQLLFQRVGISLGHAFLDSLGGAVNQILGFFQA